MPNSQTVSAVGRRRIQEAELKNRRSVRGLSFVEVAVTCLLVVAMGVLLTAGWRGGRESKRESITLAVMQESTRALLVYSQDFDGRLPYSDPEIRRTFDIGPDGATVAKNACLASVPEINVMERLVLTAPVGRFISQDGRYFKPARLTATDSFAALQRADRSQWKVFEPQDSRHMGAAPYGLADGSIKVWHPAAFRPSAVHKDQCNGDLLMGTPDSPSFVPDPKLIQYLRVKAS